MGLGYLYIDLCKLLVCQINDTLMLDLRSVFVVILLDRQVQRSRLILIVEWLLNCKFTIKNALWQEKHSRTSLNYHFDCSYTHDFRPFALFSLQKLFFSYTYLIKKIRNFNCTWCVSTHSYGAMWVGFKGGLKIRWGKGCRLACLYNIPHTKLCVKIWKF